MKSAFADEAFRDEVKLGAINSINWARVLAQITYYFYSWLRVTDNQSHAEKINFAVPTGNFGDILAGYYAKLMGLPIGRLIIATNENDVLHRFLKEGSYSKRPSRLTIAPSMDISVSSNFERYLYYLADRNAGTLASWMKTFESTGLLVLPEHLINVARSDFASHSSSESDIVTTMTSVWDNEKYLVCPHTATAVVAIRALGFQPATTVCLATAHPAKFEEAVGRALSASDIPPRPPLLEDTFHLPMRTVAMKASLSEVQKFMRGKLGSGALSVASSLLRALGYFTGAGIFAAIAVALFTTLAAAKRRK